MFYSESQSPYTTTWSKKSKFHEFLGDAHLGCMIQTNEEIFKNKVHPHIAAQ